MPSPGRDLLSPRRYVPGPRPHVPHPRQRGGGGGRVPRILQQFSVASTFTNSVPLTAVFDGVEDGDEVVVGGVMVVVRREGDIFII
ncbi:uncharacterized protein DS421_6g191760 [Arachis hypogaea]|nr:uncharacterized protein DS421_6g191760 [Arachis hypogaea]